MLSKNMMSYFAPVLANTPEVAPNPKTSAVCYCLPLSAMQLVLCICYFYRNCSLFGTSQLALNAVML